LQAGGRRFESARLHDPEIECAFPAETELTSLQSIMPPPHAAYAAQTMRDTQ